MKRFASFLLILSLLAVFVLPIVEPTYSAFAQPDGSAVADDGGDEPAEPPAEEPPPTEIPAPTEAPPPTDVPPAPTEAPPPTDVPPAPTDVPPSATQEPSATATEVPVLPAANTATPVKDFQTGDLVAATYRVNCRDDASMAGQVLAVLEKDQQVFVVEPAVELGGIRWIKVQLQDAATTRCFSSEQYLRLVQAGVGVPPTAVPTAIPTATLTPTITSTPTVTLTPTITRTPTSTFTPSNTPVSTPFKNLLPGDLVSADARVNCRDSGSTDGGVLLVVEKGQQFFVVQSAQTNGNYDWVLVQLQDAARTQCYLAAQYVTLVTAGVGVPPTLTVTPSITPSLTPSLTPTVTNTPTETPTLTGSETATPTPTETLTPTVTNTPTETLTPTITNTPTETPIATNTPTPTYNNLHAGDIVKANASTNCRVSNSALSEISWVMRQNDRAIMLTDPENVNGYWWAKVRPMGTNKECYAVAQYFDLVQAGGGFTPTPTATGSGTAVPAGPYKVGDVVQTTSSVNLRTDAGTSFPVVTTIKSGTQGTVLPGFKQSGGLDWIQVQFPTATGWLAAKYVKLVSSPSTIPGPYAAGTQLVVTSVVNLRTLPSTSSTSLGQLQPGQQGLALGTASKVGSTTWIQVEFSIGTGWISSAYVKKLTAVSPTPAPKVTNVWVYLDCTSNPERIIVQNNNSVSIKIISIGSTYNQLPGEPYSVGHTLGSKVTLTYQANSKASAANSGNKVLTTKEMFTDSAGAQDGAIVKTSVGDVVAACPAATSGEKWIEVNLSTQTLYAYVGSTVVSSSLVSTGKPGFDTPTGTYRIFAKYPLVNMAACIKGECYDTPNVPWDMLFKNGGFYIHGAYWHHDFGKVRSHGCVNLPVPYAEWIYGWAPMNTRVWIHY